MVKNYYGFCHRATTNLKGYDSVWVIVDRLTKSTHFLPVKTTYGGVRYAQIFMNKIVLLHRVLVSIIFDRGSQFTSRFWKSFQEALGTRGALYGRRCRSPIRWFEAGETNLLGLDLVQEAMDKVQLIRQRFLTAQNRQKSYADKRRRDLVFTIGDKVFLRVSPMKGVMRFRKRGNLSPRKRETEKERKQNQRKKEGKEKIRRKKWVHYIGAIAITVEES
ncbi:uncharacterized protein [Nicotiana sylvestris]|uniref:uncharacterized protein n=1 Tax=Nicotiana sylvestris TaxID=4096 RepID=UPI00388C4567